MKKLFLLTLLLLTTAFVFATPYTDKIYPTPFNYSLVESSLDQNTIQGVKVMFNFDTYVSQVCALGNVPLIRIYDDSGVMVASSNVYNASTNGSSINDVYNASKPFSVYANCANFSNLQLLGGKDYYIVSAMGGGVGGVGYKSVSNASMFPINTPHMVWKSGVATVTPNNITQYNTTAEIYQIINVTIKSNDAPFTVTLMNKDGGAAYIQIDTLFDNYALDGVYKFEYSADCDYKSGGHNTYYFNDRFNGANWNISQYNITQLGAPIGFNFSGMTSTVNETNPFWLNKNISTAISGDVVFDLSFDSADDYWLYVTFEPDVSGFTIHKNETNKYTVYSYKYGVLSELLGTTTSTSGVIKFVMEKVIGSPTLFINGTTYASSVTIGTWSSNNITLGTFDGNSISDVSIYTDSNANITVGGLSAYKRQKLPTMVQFTNGLLVNGMVEYDSPDGDNINGGSFVIRPYFNRTFKAVCQYDKTGNYTIRSYMENTLYGSPYSNYKDTIIQITDKNMFNYTPDLTYEESSNIFGQTAKSLGISYETATFLFWIIGTVVVAIALVVYISPLIAAIIVPVGFVVGTVLGVIPTWVTVVMVVCVAAIVAFWIKNAIGDSASGE